MYDSNLVFQAQTTKTTSFTSASVDFKTTPGTPPRGMKARVRVPSFSAAAAGAVATFSVEESADDSTFTTLFTADGVTAISGTITSTNPIDMPFVMTKRYARLKLTMSPATGTPSLVYASEIGLASPG
jgi:hypothetical protein